MQSDTSTFSPAERSISPWDHSTQQRDTPMSEYFDVLWVHKAIFVAVLLGCISLATLLTYSTSPVYQSRGVLELEVPPSASLTAPDGDSSHSINGQTFDAYLQTQIGILGSDTLIRKVVERIQLARRMNAYRPQGLVGIRKKLISPHAPGAVTPAEAFEAAKKNLIVRQSRLNNLIEVLYTSNDPQTAADFVNTLSEEYAQQNLEARWQMSQRASTWLTRQLTDLRAKLEESENALQNYSRAKGLLLVADKNSIAKERLQQLQQELSTAQSERMHRQSELSMATGASPNSMPEVLDNPILKEYQIKLSELRLRLTEYRQIYVPDSPKIQLVLAQISSVEAAFEEQRKSVLAKFNNEFQGASQKEHMLREEYASQAKLVSDQGDKMIRYDTLKHDVDSNRILYESLLQKVKESGVSLALQATNVRIVDAAVPTTVPLNPNKVINLGVGALAGILFGLTTVILLEYFDQSVRRPGVTSQLLTAPELGVIPYTSETRTSSYGPGFFRRGLARLPGASHNEREDLLEVKAWLDPDSPLGDSFRFVMTSLLFRGLSAGGRLLVVTSAGAGEGKTTITMNLAAALAKTGRRVLIVDADLRRPRMHNIFGLPASPGLLEFAEEWPATTNLSAEIRKFIRRTSVPNLSLMACGTSDASEPPPLLSSMFSRAFVSLRSEFDTVLVDSSPLLYMPETRMMAHLADGVVLVVRAGATRVEDVMMAERQLLRDGCTLVGTVLNQASANHSNTYARSTVSIGTLSHT